MPQQPEADWGAIVERIQAGDPAAEEFLYQTLSKGARFFLQRRLGTVDVDDSVHDVFLTVSSAIRRGEVREPERLMGFVRTVLYRHLSGEIDRAARRRGEAADDTVSQMAAPDSTPEERAIAAQKLELMAETLRELSDRDFEVLTRFYLREQTAAQICSEMGLTQVQYQLLKSRAKARLTDRMRRRLGAS